MTEDCHVRLAGDALTHRVSWADDVGGYTRCGLLFRAHNGDPRVNTRVKAEVVEDECDCMTCLVGIARNDGFVFFLNNKQEIKIE